MLSGGATVSRQICRSRPKDMSNIKWQHRRQTIAVVVNCNKPRMKSLWCHTLQSHPTAKQQPHYTHTISETNSFSGTTGEHTEMIHHFLFLLVQVNHRSTGGDQNLISQVKECISFHSAVFFCSAVSSGSLTEASTLVQIQTTGWSVEITTRNKPIHPDRSIRKPAAFVLLETTEIKIKVQLHQPEAEHLTQLMNLNLFH